MNIVPEISARAATAHHTLEGEGPRRPAQRLPQTKLTTEFNQILRGRIRGFESDMPSQTVRLSTLLRALDRAAFLGARNREAVRAGDMGKGLALI